MPNLPILLAISGLLFMTGCGGQSDPVGSTTGWLNFTNSWTTDEVCCAGPPREYPVHDCCAEPDDVPVEPAAIEDYDPEPVSIASDSEPGSDEI